ncbi:hypothetical protein TRP8649_03530 [Pelagimonas phthalicica]|uniref:IrrE N-terminal-like domain-containing protein n=1 Tax=Pelagimonas phthalicica TaxID=1037362 RepID=A0A238JHV5_9RHOB|nr:hypothetical protein [Pelagimonas phthalicica]TDS92335.1 hypothetical protein CLV87_3527 [Pelagimonas phthalicica]SMX29396.1 hypothetical protein TRP8649_03530 [Pelagimonas phthalicica]
MLRALIEKFQDCVMLPIEIDEIRDAIIELGVQDKIIFSGEDLDTGVLKGAFYQWYESSGMYAESTWTTLIVYPDGEPIEMQRVICAKELIHICDKAIARTHTPELIDKLAKKVLGPFESPDTSSADLMATIDKLAQYQGLDLLLPKAAREIARDKISKGLLTPSDVAEAAVMPLSQTLLVLDESWEDISSFLCTISNGH